MIKTLQSAGDLSGKKVLLRVDFNVPIVKGEIVNDFRIKAVIPTLEYLKKAGAETIIVSHLMNQDNDSLRPVAEFISKTLPVSFIGDLDFFSLEGKIAGIGRGEFVMIENLRRDKGEEANSEKFTKDLASLADIYVNEAFSASHRPHASIVGVPKLLPSFAGIRFMKEYEELAKCFHPLQPFLVIIGGAKFETKEPLLKKLTPIAHTIFVGGALANDFFKAKGWEIGISKTSTISPDEGLLENPRVLLPIDVTIRREDGTPAIKKPTEVLASEKILDVGPETVKMLREKISESQMVLWNGPMGAYEEGFIIETESLAKALADSRSYSVVGGGDTAASIRKLNLQEQFSFLSTAGGAMLQFLATETLPGIDALNSSN